MNIQTANYQQSLTSPYSKQRNNQVNFKGAKGDILVKMLKENNGNLSQVEVQSFIDNHLGKIFNKKSKDLLESLLPYIAGLAGTIAATNLVVEKMQTKENKLSQQNDKVEEANKALEARNAELALEIIENDNKPDSEKNKIILTDREIKLADDLKIKRKKEIERKELATKREIEIERITKSSLFFSKEDFTKYWGDIKPAKQDLILRYLISKGCIKPTEIIRGEQEDHASWEGPCEKGMYGEHSPGAYLFHDIHQYYYQRLSNGGKIKFEKEIDNNGYERKIFVSYTGPDPRLTIV